MALLFICRNFRGIMEEIIIKQKKYFMNNLFQLLGFLLDIDAT